jgi:hypothetical protein
MTLYEAVIKVNRDEPPSRRARDIAEGIGYACALLHDEYAWTADAIEELLERTIADVRDAEELEQA